MFVLTAMHGNEPAGPVAARRVLQALQDKRLPVRGRIETRVGNPQALERGVRFVHHDLNRVWTSQDVAALRARSIDEPLEHEDAAQLALLDVLREVRERAGDRLIVVDLHSTSAEGTPFTCISDTLESRALARALPVPLVLGIEESIRGSTLDFFETIGTAAIVVEGGVHTDPATADRHEAALWLLLVAAGMLAADDVPDYAAMQARLREAARGMPDVVDVVHRHAVANDDGFEMTRGFRNFDRVRRGQIVARDRTGPVRAPLSGRLAMPLYQALGDDGFFIVRRVHPRWLDVSTAARRVRLGRLLRRLPGVRAHPELADAVMVDRHVARWWVLEAFHLAGYRRVAGDDSTYTFQRRSE